MFLPVHKLAKGYQALQKRVERAKEKTEETVGEVLRTVETVGTCGAMSYANAYYGKQPKNPPQGSVGLFEIDAMGVPVDLGAGLALSATTAFGLLGKYKEHGYNIGNGLMCAYMARLGTQMGQKALTDKNVKNVQGTPATAGALGYGPYSSYQGTRQNVSAGVG